MNGEVAPRSAAGLLPTFAAISAAPLPLLVVNHATAEEWGLRSLAAYLQAQFPGVPVRHFPQGCLYRVV